MKKIMICTAMVVAVALIFWARHTPTTTEEVAASEPIRAVLQATAPVKSVQELAKRYEGVELTPSQRKLVAAGFDPKATHSITINK